MYKYATYLSSNTVPLKESENIFLFSFLPDFTYASSAVAVRNAVSPD